MSGLESFGYFVDVLEKLSGIAEHTKGTTSLNDTQSNNACGIVLHVMYQEIEARFAKIGKNQAVGKLVDAAQEEIQMTRKVNEKADVIYSTEWLSNLG